MRSEGQSIFQNYEAPKKGAAPVLNSRPQEDIEREKQLALKNKRMEEKAKQIVEVPEEDARRNGIPIALRSPYDGAQMDNHNQMHSHPRYVPLAQIEEAQKKALQKIEEDRQKKI